MLSVVVPTKDRRETVLRTVAALAAQDPPAEGFEVVVVDDGSSDGTVNALRATAASLPQPVRVVPGSGRGPASARNRGVEVAEGDVLLFLGDDTAPQQRGLLVGHEQLHSKRSNDRFAVLGRIEWDPRHPPTRFMRWLTSAGPQFSYTRLQPGPVSAVEHFYSSHVSVRKSMIERVGGFDERFPLAAVEDTELGTRLSDAGVVLEYRPELVVLHDHPTTVEGSLRRVERVGQAARLYNEIRPERPHPHLAVPYGPKWRALEVASAPVQALALRPPPGPLRSAVWRLAHLASYRRGYVRAPPLPVTLHRL